jgi:hypothetical protein
VSKRNPMNQVLVKLQATENRRPRLHLLFDFLVLVDTGDESYAEDMTSICDYLSPRELELVLGIFTNFGFFDRSAFHLHRLIEWTDDREYKEWSFRGCSREKLHCFVLAFSYEELKNIPTSVVLEFLDQCIDIESTDIRPEFDAFQKR